MFSSCLKKAFAIYLRHTMMIYLRGKQVKYFFSFVLVCALLMKICAFSLSVFSSGDHVYSIEKSAEENKDKEEESLDKAKKKLILFESSIFCDDHQLWIYRSPVRSYSYKLQISNFPPKNVPTPPPDFVS